MQFSQILPTHTVLPLGCWENVFHLCHPLTLLSRSPQTMVIENGWLIALVLKWGAVLHWTKIGGASVGHWGLFP